MKTLKMKSQSENDQGILLKKLIAATKPTELAYEILINKKSTRPKKSQEKWVRDCKLQAVEDLNWTFRVRSIGKSGFRFWISDFGFPNKTRNPKTDFDKPKSFSKTDFN